MGKNEKSPADFSAGLEGWNQTIANWGSADATEQTSGGAITYSIKNAGNVDWNVQLKQEKIELQKGHTYNK